MRALAFSLAFLAGALVTLQIGSNAKLKEAVGGALPAVIVSSLLGIVLLALTMLVTQSPWPSPSSWPDTSVRPR